jgi:hypothetical protein
MNYGKKFSRVMNLLRPEVRMFIRNNGIHRNKLVRRVMVEVLDLQEQRRAAERESVA